MGAEPTQNPEYHSGILGDWLDTNQLDTNWETVISRVISDWASTFVNEVCLLNASSLNSSNLEIRPQTWTVILAASKILENYQLLLTALDGRRDSTTGSVN